MKARTAAFPWQNGRPPHLPCGPGDIAPVVLLPGDPARVSLAAALYGGVRDFGQRREFRVATVETPSGPVSICSSGIGGPSTEIALVELANLGARAVIRIGGMGAIAPGLQLGSMLAVDAAIGGTGAGGLYRSGPAVATPAVVAALETAARDLKLECRRGTVATTDSYYRGQGRPIAQDGPVVADPIPAFVAAGALGCDMETETLFTVGPALGLQVGAILAVHGDRVTDTWLEDYEPAQTSVVRVGVAAAALLEPLLR